ncbi:MAG TPA: VOC family protein [Candidatus Bilamarchaeum sp.]|nr:VOC family protein [Candidatus Bilamarchaeum sp.]
MLFLSLDFIYLPAPDFEATLRHYTKDMGGEIVWRTNAMGTSVAQIKLSDEGPAILLAGHLEGKVPILIYRVKDFRAAISELKAKGLKGRELEIPHGPCYSFEVPSGQRFAVYELVRPEANKFFTGKSNP